ncbi:MAG TPA: phosphatase PAP2 family protein [Candidatus Lokiarchaeia archaeon]|nr:phosphatase PAP2 family protein [Candidatus Lokiarchaeia archaeon]
MHILDSFQKCVERLFFHKESTKWSKRATYWICNIILMLFLFLGGVILLGYEWTGGLHTEGTGFHLDGWFGGLDDTIPYVPEMAIFYIFVYYGILVFTMVYFAFFAYEKGIALGLALVIIGAIALVVFIVFPVSTNIYRASIVPRGPYNYWAGIMLQYFTIDSSFNDFPSLHSATVTAVAYVWYRYARLKRMKIRTFMAIFAVVAAIGVMLSTLFVKQHFIADVIAGFALAFVVSKLVFRKAWNQFEVKVDLIKYQLDQVQENQFKILEKWNISDANEFLEKSTEGKYPGSETDASDLKQLLAKEKELKLML